MTTPIWVTLLVAAAVLAGTLFTALQAHRTAQAAASIAAQASRFTVRSDRFADWQMHKRAVYTRLLASVREAYAARDHDSGMRMAHCFDEAFLVADPDLFVELTMLQTSALHSGDGAIYGQT